MSTFVESESSTAVSRSIASTPPVFVAAPTRRTTLSHPTSVKTSESKKDGLIVAIITTSACLHLILVGLTGYGGPKEVTRPVVHKEVHPPAIIENVHIEDAPPPPQHPKEVLNQPTPADDLTAPAPAAAVDAVAANVAVNFAIKVAGPVHLVSTTADTTGILAAPVVVPHEVTGRNLLTPEVSYPPVAKYKHLTGHVVVEFRTTATGDIVDVKVRSSSGHAELDEAAINNLRLGRWVGEAGYFTKSYEFVLH